MAPVRWGVMGTAKIALGRVVPAMLQAAGVTVAAIASRDIAKAREAAAKLGIATAYGSYEALLADPQIEAVYIPLPNHLHVPWCLKALDAGKHVLCEKPLALGSADIAMLIEARQRTGLIIEEAFSYRNHPQWDAVAKLVGEGAIGEVRAVQGTIAFFTDDPEDIRNNPALGGGALYDTGSYVLSACSLVTGRAPERVIAAMDIDPKCGVDGTTTVLLDYGRAHASFTASLRAGPTVPGTHQQFSVLGSKGWLRLDFPYAHARQLTCRVQVGDTTSIGAFPVREISFEPAPQYALMVERFSRLVRGDAARAWPIEGSLDMLRSIEALFRSVKSGAWERVAH